MERPYREVCVEHMNPHNMSCATRSRLVFNRLANKKAQHASNAHALCMIATPGAEQQVSALNHDAIARLAADLLLRLANGFAESPQFIVAGISQVFGQKFEERVAVVGEKVDSASQPRAYVPQP